MAGKKDLFSQSSRAGLPGPSFMVQKGQCGLAAEDAEQRECVG